MSWFRAVMFQATMFCGRSAPIVPSVVIVPNIVISSGADEMIGTLTRNTFGCPGHRKRRAIARLVSLVQPNIVQPPNLILPSCHPANVAEVRTQLGEVGERRAGGNSAATTSSTEVERASIQHSVR